jgi:flagellar basal-body rod protein FlgB
MLNSLLFSHSGQLEKTLDAAWLRHEVIANNISNVDTPNFKSAHVEFESVLKNALEGSKIEMKKTRPEHLNPGGKSLSDIKPAVALDNDTTMRMDGNNVDIEKEQINMVKNAIQYNTLIEKISKEFSRIKLAVNEGN